MAIALQGSRLHHPLVPVRMPHRSYRWRRLYLPAMGASRCLLVVLLLWAQSGCSFLFVQGPPPRDENSRPPLFDSECTRSRLFPIADTVLAAWAGSTLLGTLILSTIGTPPADQTPAEREASQHKALVIEISALAIGAIPTASAIWGFHTTRKCRDYEEGAWPRRRQVPTMETDERMDAGD